ncbi:putative proteasome ATPase [Rosa chinensis]|uniref:Putative proteasome ATPase n=1 Tax=Rosa chinensis TaxID=74649 RepID=A0A2P6QCB8_ROSCH|nr:26S proteasome regulatory subunit 6B homolog [Rosa chinensis]PRQ31827.1 putative proteasome ATPase [Rosa chinensis]
MQPTLSSDLKLTDQHQSSDEDDLYSCLKSLQRQLEFIDIQEEYVRILSTINREHLKPSTCVALHLHSNALVDVLPPEADSSISLLSQSEKPDVTYNISHDIGGCDIQKQEIREAVELPLTHHDLYKQIGIDPPRGVLLYGPPGTGKTMLAKAVANHTTAAFIRVVGSEFVQKYLGEGPRMVHDVFRLAKENAPAIIFIDEVDAIATTRFDPQTGADKKVQQILMKLLNQVVPGRFYIEEQKYFC